MGRRSKKAELCKQATRSLAKLQAERPLIDGEHFIIFRWPGPGLFERKLNGVTLRHCYPTKSFSLSERCVLSALKAGFQYVRWANL